MECGFIRSICKFENNKAVENLHREIKMCITNSLKELDYIFEQVPKAWGFSKKSKDKVKDFLSDDIRNKRISETYLHFLKK